MIDDDRYFWKDRQRQRGLDPDARRTFQGMVWVLIAGAWLLVIIGLVA